MPYQIDSDAALLPYLIHQLGLALKWSGMWTGPKKLYNLLHDRPILLNVMWSASWQFQNISQYFSPQKDRRYQPTYICILSTFVTTTMMQNYSQRVTCDMPVLCLMFVLFAYSYTAFLMVDSFAASPIHSWDFCKKNALWSKLSHFPVTAWLLKSQNSSKHCL